MPNDRYRLIQEVQQHPRVRLALRRKRDELLREAQVIARQEGANITLTTSDGTRPKGRSYSRLSAPSTDEFGDSRTKRIRLLGRVARA